MIIPLPIIVSTFPETALIQPPDDIVELLRSSTLRELRLRGGGNVIERWWGIELISSRKTELILNGSDRFDPVYEWIYRNWNINLSSYMTEVTERMAKASPTDWQILVWRAAEPV